MIEPSLQLLLSQDAGVMSIVQGRFYPQRVPQDGARPAIVFKWISAERWCHLQGSSKVAGPHLQLDCEASVYEDAKQLSDYVRLALDEYPLQQGLATPQVVGGFSIQHIYLIDQREDDSPPIAANDLPVFRVMLDFRVRYSET